MSRDTYMAVFRAKVQSTRCSVKIVYSEKFL